MPEDIISGFLQKSLPDPKNRGSRWIYPEKPQLLDLIDDVSNFPIISIESLGSSTISQLSLDCAGQEDFINLLVNAWSIKDDLVELESNEETITFSENSDYLLNNIPFNKIVSIYNHTAQQSVELQNYNIKDSAGYGIYDSVFISGQNEGDSLSIKTSRMGEGVDVVNYLIQESHKLLRDNWHTVLTEYNFFDYVRTGNSSVMFEEDIRLYRKEMQIRLNAINAGD